MLTTEPIAPNVSRTARPSLRTALTPFSRELILSHFPAAAGDSEEAVVLRRWLETLLTARWRDAETDGIVLTYQMVAALDDHHPHAHGFNAGIRMREVERKLMRFHVQHHDHHAGRARVVRPEVPAEVAAIWELELTRTQPNEHVQRVDFVTGEPISRRNREAELGHYRDGLRAEVRAPAGHPGLALQAYLNDQPQQALTRLVRRNWAAACRATLDLSPGIGRHLAIGTMLHLAEQQHLIYNTVAGSHRLFAMGTNLTQLPRTVRQRLLRGSWQHDLASAQLAIVARVWHIPLLLAFLEDQQLSVWTYLLESVGLTDAYKPVLKRAVYRIIFGGRRDRALRDLTQGSSLEQGMEPAQAEALLGHPLMQALLEARDRALGTIANHGRVQDAFGVRHALRSSRAHEVRSLLALQAQSYEQLLMLELLPILEAEQKTRVVAWLHDGFYTSGPEAERLSRRMQRAVDQRAAELRIPTSLESKCVN